MRKVNKGCRKTKDAELLEDPFALHLFLNKAYCKCILIIVSTSILQKIIYLLMRNPRLDLHVTAFGKTRLEFEKKKS